MKNKVELIVRDNCMIRQSLTPSASMDLWFFHGFGESGFSFKEAFESKLAESFNLFVPDTPGFGESPRPDEPFTVRDTSNFYIELVKQVSGHRPVVLVGHSLGGIVMTQMTEVMGDQIKGLVSIEGNLVRADCVYTSKAMEFEEPQGFYDAYLDRSKSLIDKQEAFARYYASVKRTTPEALFAWGRSCFEETGDHISGDAFLALDTPKIYFWGTREMPKETLDYVQSHPLKNIRFDGAGHWLMLEQPEKCYSEIERFLADECQRI